MLEPWDGGLLLSAAQSLTLYAADGKASAPSRSTPRPRWSFGGRLFRAAPGAAAIALQATTAAATSPAWPVRYQHTCSSYSPQYAWFVLKDHESTGPALGRIDRHDGRLTGVIGLEGDKTLEYVINPGAGLVVIKRDDTLMAYRW